MVDETGGERTYTGTGETMKDALQDAAEQAVADSRDDVGVEFDIVRHIVVVDNPRISQHKVTIS